MFYLSATLSALSYGLTNLTLLCAVGLLCAALLSQSVRSSPRKSWAWNINTIVIGASFVAVFIISLLIVAKRRIAIGLRLSKISKVYKTVNRADYPKSVRRYINQEYARSCWIAYEAVPKEAMHEGWGRPGTSYDGIRFRQVLLDTIPEIDGLARALIPSHPPLKPHDRMLHHFRFLLPLLPRDEDGISLLHYYDSCIQLARTSRKEPTESEFELGMTSASEIMQCLNELAVERSTTTTEASTIGGEELFGQDM